MKLSELILEITELLTHCKFDTFGRITQIQ